MQQRHAKARPLNLLLILLSSVIFSALLVKKHFSCKRHIPVNISKGSTRFGLKGADFLRVTLPIASSDYWARRARLPRGRIKRARTRAICPAWTQDCPCPLPPLQTAVTTTTSLIKLLHLTYRFWANREWDSSRKRGGRLCFYSVMVLKRATVHAKGSWNSEIYSKIDSHVSSQACCCYLYSNGQEFKKEKKK